MSGKQGMSSAKATEVSGRFEPGFLSALDGRSVVARGLKSNLDALINDLGGALSYQQHSLCERVIHLEALIRGMDDPVGSGSSRL